MLISFPHGKDPQSTPESPPGGINVRVNVSMSLRDIVTGIALMMYIICDAAVQAGHLTEMIASYLLSYLIMNHFLLWFLIT